MPDLLPVALNPSGISSFCPFHAPEWNDRGMPPNAPPGLNDQDILFLSCLFVCLSVDNFNIHYNF